MWNLRLVCVIAAAALFLTSCGMFDFEEREPWRAQMEARCLASKLVVPSAFITPMKAIDGPRTCGVDHPFHVNGLHQGNIAVEPRARLGCPMIPALERWMMETVQPAAMANFGSQVIQIKNMASYGCRSRNNQRGAPLSEHSFANALDIGAFRLADGREVMVKSGWKGAPEEQMFLRQVLAGACKVFTTVLGPGSDAFHYDHFHLDLRLHDAYGRRRICKPVPSPDLPPAGTPFPGGPSVPTAHIAPPQQGYPPPQAPVMTAQPVPAQTYPTAPSAYPVPQAPVPGYHDPMAVPPVAQNPYQPAPYPMQASPLPVPIMSVPQAPPLAYPPAPSAVRGLSATPRAADDPFAPDDDDITGSVRR